MKVIYSDDHRLHDGAKELAYGRLVPMYEMPRRLDMILQQLAKAGFGEQQPPERFPMAPILAVHDPDYVDFLSKAFDLWRAEEKGGNEYAMGFTFGMRGLRQRPGRSVHSKIGHFTFDLSVPFVAGTWQAIKSAADVALTGQALVAGGQHAVFSLCRPPGHHAMRDMAGGYCYVNNAAVAAQAFRDAGAAQVAILDVDYHHGNGTQFIFYDRADVLFVSIHGHPDQEYPYFAGYAEETGAGAGAGFNLNLPLPWGTTWDSGYRAALEAGIARVREFDPEVLVVSLGVDTFKDDPISHFKLESADYPKIGEAIAALRLPTLFVMEGGYAVEAIGVNAVGLLQGFEGGAG